MADTKIKNTKTKVLPSEDAYNDENRLVDLMTSLKHLNFVLPIALQEASNTALYDSIKTVLLDVSTLQRDAFNLLFVKGWYQLEAQTQEKINTSYQSFSKKKKEFN